MVSSLTSEPLRRRFRINRPDRLGTRVARQLRRSIKVHMPVHMHRYSPSLCRTRPVVPAVVGTSRLRPTGVHRARGLLHSIDQWNRVSSLSHKCFILRCSTRPHQWATWPCGHIQAILWQNRTASPRTGPATQKQLQPKNQEIRSFSLPCSDRLVSCTPPGGTSWRRKPRHGTADCQHLRMTGISTHRGHRTRRRRCW